MKWWFKTTSDKLNSLSLLFSPQRNAASCLCLAQQGITPPFLTPFIFPFPFTPESPFLLLPPCSHSWWPVVRQHSPAEAAPDQACPWCRRLAVKGSLQMPEAFPLDHPRAQVSKMPSGLSCFRRHGRNSCPQVASSDCLQGSMWSEESQILRPTLRVTYRLLFCISFSSVKWE